MAHDTIKEVKASSHRRRRLLASTAILCALVVSSPAQANDACGIGSSVVCDANDVEYFDDFPEGITYDPVADLTLVVDGGASIVPTSNVGIQILDGLGNAIDITLQDGASITTTGKSGIGVYSPGDVAVTLQGASSIVTSGTYAFGIYVENTVNNATVTLSEESLVKTSGSFAHGVNITYTGGDVSLYALGTIETKDDFAHAIRLSYNDGNVNLVSTGTITTYGMGAGGIYLVGNYGTVSVQSAAYIATYGDYASAIAVSTISDGDISITHTDSITTSGDVAHGIHIFESNSSDHILGSNVTLATTAGSSIVTRGDRADGIHIDYTNSNVIADVTLDLAGSIEVQGADSDGLYIKDALGSIDIDISGSLSGGTGDGAAIRILGDSPATIDNSGSISGAVITGDGDDVFTNAGILYTDEVDMGGGYNTLVNSGTLELTGASGSIANLESFTHSGVIDLANGTAGDTLSISGEFVSAGGAVYLDANLDTGTADVLTLATVAASSNPTFIYVTGPESGTAPASPILLIDAASDDSAGSAFVSAPFGAYQYELTYDPSLFNWYLGAMSIYPGTAEYPALLSGALLAFGSDLSALSERLRGSFGDGKDRIEPAAWTGGSNKLRPWIHLNTSRQDISGAAAFDLDVSKIEVGADAGFTMAGGARYSLGAFAGAGRTLQEFQDSSSEADADILTLGLSGAYRSGPFRTHAVLKYEHHALDYASLAANDELGLDLLGLSLEGGYRIEHGTSYVQPRARLSYAHAWAASFEDSSGAAIDLSRADSLSGELAARLGLAGFYVDLALHHEFLGETQAEVSGLTFSDELPGTTARLATGVDWALLDGRLNLSLEAGYARGKEAEELSATAALRFNY